MIPEPLVDALYAEASAARWRVPRDAFAAALAASAGHGGVPAASGARDLERYLRSLHVADLALACACSLGNDAAWEHFVREHRPALYRAAAALVRGDASRELADSLYAELYGIRGGRDARESLFRYFHGRSSLATWLRAILAQRHVDRVRAERRLEPLGDEVAQRAASGAPDVECPRQLALVDRALRVSVARLAPKDRLRLRAYYAQDLTLAEIGRMTREHEATVSRHLARTRRSIRAAIEAFLREDAGLGPDGIARCFECALQDPGTLDVSRLFGAAERKNAPAERS
jgi:RNA polymerase sigma factor (sigma-70 family)